MIADVYGDNEELLGKWFKANPEKRKDIFLATKFGITMNSDGSINCDSTPEYVKAACEKSLGRLGVPHIDLYYCHRLDQKTPIERTVQAMVELKNEGKIKYLGLSECSAESLRRAHEVHPITAVQMEYSPFTLDIEHPQTKLLDMARKLGIAVVAYSPLGRGMLSGKLRSPSDLADDDARKYMPRFSPENFHKNLKLVDEITAIAKAKGVEATQVTLAWLLAQGDDIFPIPGTTRVERLVENVNSFKFKLTQEEEARIREVCNEAEIGGSRYTESFLASCFADTPLL
ncbi:hypothetical protein ACMFMG_007866 [Clarireedia jacksonii]